ncbi:MAG TPA: DNA polymerase III subunit gamma/tau [Chthonomonadales bacterium]|nr:DNA polymerase III subunit gamma/tau [Chthonomonadales bacterium]
MPYVALYRKHRSQSFDEVVGQGHVTTVLRNAIRKGKLAHAYLFCGPRGCGKTSTARLLARALNCTASADPTPDPCGKCEMCARIRSGSAIDVVEMDAASETGIDDVREKIIENAKYSPAEARYKVYVIDEVHDLSQKAFDSLLKTIEEPPPHVVFVLATTEAHKVPVTIRSRCQRMDFRRGSLADLRALLERVLAAEGVSAEPEAVGIVARAAEGSFRDALSILEQVLAYSDGALTVESVQGAVGVVGPQALDDMTAAIASDDMRQALEAASAIVDAGRDVRQVLVELQAHLRDLLVLRMGAEDTGLAALSAERVQQLRGHAEPFAAAQLLAMLDVLAEAERDIRFTNQQRLLLERALWRCQPSRLASPAPSAAGAQKQPAARPAGAPVARQAHRPAPPPPARPAAPPSEEMSGAAASDRFAPELDLAAMQRLWPRVRDQLVRRARSAAAVFGDERVIAFEGSTVVLGFTSAFKMEKASRDAARSLIESVLREVAGRGDLRVRCTHTEPAPTAATLSDTRLPLEPGDASNVPDTVEEQFVQEVLTTFDGEITEA